MDVTALKQIRHAKERQMGYPARREDSGVDLKNDNGPSVALLFVDSDEREKTLRSVLSQDFSRVVVLRTMDEGIWTARRILAGGETIGFCLFDGSVRENDMMGFIGFARGRGNLRDLPVLVMTGENDPDARVRVLDAGADEVLAISCPPRETVARVHSLMRRRLSKAEENLDAPARYEAGALVVDTERHEVRWKGTRVLLTPLEFRILTRLIRQPGKAFSREELMKQLWGEHWEVEDHNLSVHIHGLRKKLSEGTDPCRMIETVRGVGYRFREERS